MSTPANGSNPNPLNSQKPPRATPPKPPKPPKQQGTLHGSSVTTEPTDKKNADSPTLEKNSAPHIAADNRNISLFDSKSKDIPTIASTVKKHSSLWVLFQKVKRFIRTLSMCKDSKNITSKDTKPIPQDMINYIQSLKQETDDDNEVSVYQGEDSFCVKLSNYNLMCASLTVLENSIKESKETNKTKKSSKTSSANEHIKTNELEKQKLQKELLSLSKEIFAYADDEIKNSERIVEKSNKDVSKKAYANFFEVLKSNISFDAGKFAVRILSDSDEDENLSIATIDKLFSNISDKTDEDLNNLRDKYEAFKEVRTEYEVVLNSESVGQEKKDELFTKKNKLRKDLSDSCLAQGEKFAQKFVQLILPVERY